MINFKTIFMACLFVMGTTAFAESYFIDKTIVQSNQGQHFFSLELNNVIDPETANKLQVTDGEGNAIEGTIQFLPKGTALKTSIVQFFPTQQDCFKKIITLTLGEVSTRIVPGTSGISGVSALSMEKSGFAYSAPEAQDVAKSYGFGSGVEILDVIPRHETPDASPYTPLMVFFGDIIDTDTVNAENMILKDTNGNTVSGQIGFSTSTAGNTIVTFTPNSPLKANTDYVFEVNANLKDSKIWEQFQKIGNASEPEEGDNNPETLTQDQVLEKRKEVIQKIHGHVIYNSLIWMPVSYREIKFKTGSDNAISENLIKNMNFQKGTLHGFSKSGGAYVTSSFGSLQIQSAKGSDNNVAVISSLDSSPRNNPGGTAGSLVTADIKVPAGAQWMAFDTNFITAEFPSYIGSIYDDTYLVSIRTPFGVQTINVASVNSLGLFKINKTVTGAPGLIGSLDKFNALNADTLPAVGKQPLNGETTWHTRAFFVGGLVGQTINLSFHITNVGDNIYQSMAFIDNIRFVKKQPNLKSTDLKNAYKVVSSGKITAAPSNEVATVNVTGQNLRRDLRYVLSQVVGTDSYKLSAFTTLFNTLTTFGSSQTYFGQKNGENIELYPEGVASSERSMIILKKMGTGYAISHPPGVTNFVDYYLNPEKYNLELLMTLIANKREFLSGGNKTPGVVDPIEPPTPILPLKED